MDIDSEIFAPVVTWLSVRLFLVISLNLGWKTVSLDLDNVFIQTPLHNAVYMKTRSIFINEYGHFDCLKLKELIYGSVFALKLWWDICNKACTSLV